MSHERHDPAEQLLTETEVAAMLRRSVKTLQSDRRLGRGLQYVKIGRSVRYRLADVLEYVKNGKSGGVAVFLMGMLMDYS